MRYLRVLLLALCMGFTLLFCYQNQELVVVQLSLDWLGFTISKRVPLFLPVFAALFLGLLFTTLYFFLHHTQLRMQGHWQNGEVKRLKKLVLEEREKNTQLQQQVQQLQNQHRPPPPTTALPPSAPALPAIPSP